MFAFKVSPNYNPKRNQGKKYISESEFQKLYKWHPIALIPFILGIHYGIIPAVLSFIPQTIIILLGTFITLAIVITIFSLEILGDPSKWKESLLSIGLLLELANHVALLALLFFMGWTVTFGFYLVPVVMIYLIYGYMVWYQLKERLT